MSYGTRNFLLLAGATSLLVVLFAVFIQLSEAYKLQTNAIASAFSAAAIAGTGLVALLSLDYTRKTKEESWLVTYRELHKEFWTDEKMAKVRAWLCCDDAYKNELKPILAKRLDGQILSADYETLDLLDRFCAVMLRVAHMDAASRSKQQIAAYRQLGYFQWMYIMKRRPEVVDYLKLHWEHLHDKVVDAKLYSVLPE